MLNKLKRTKTSKNASFTSKNPLRATEVITLVLSEDETSPERDSVSLAAIDSKASNAAAGGISSSKAQLLQEKRRTCCAKDVKIAPIFLRTTQQGKRKRSSDGGLDRPVDELQKSVLPPQSDDSQLVKSQLSTPAGSHLTERKGSCRGQLSSSAVLSCLEEIQTSNPAFPVQRVFDTLQEKDLGSSVKSSYSRQSWFKGKRKCGNESSQVSKRLRCSLTTEGTTGTSHRPLPAHGVQESADVSVKQQPRSSRLSRTHRLKQQRESVGLVNNCETNSESDRQSLITCDILQRDSSFEDVLWTDKYSPQCSSEVIGNSASVKKLHSWLKKWKLRADCDERRKKEERKQEENSSDSWDCGDFQGEAVTEGNRVEPLCNTMLITGPSGVGKTASVYACAQELGFKVFEVNCSSQRSGRHVLSQLKEATQSHLVETSGRDPLKPAYFNNYNTKSCSTNSENVPGKSAAPKNVISSSKKRPAQKFGRKRKANPAAVTLANYFKMKAKADHLHFGGLSPPPEKPDIKKLNNSSPGWDQTAPQNKQTTTSLILFEEVDVVFEDDVGFLAAIKTFMTTTKRPVVLTTNDPSFRERFSCSLEEIVFKTPSAMNVCSYLQLVCLAENVRLELDDVLGLLTLTRGDVRRCLLQLQLWVNGGGGGRASQNSNVEGGVSLDPQLPPGDAGCTSSMLGLHPATQNHLLNLLQSWTDPDMNKLLQLLAESWRRNVPLLYCNQELLLPIRAEGSPVHYLDKVTSSGQQSQLDGNINPKATAANSDSVRNISRLSRRKYTSAAFDATSSSNLTQKPQRASLTFKATHLRAQSSDDKTEPNADKVATDCLDALTDFFDLMSYLNATKPAAEPLISGSCRPEFVWTGAEMKDSLLDEMREEEEEEEEGRSCCQERWLDIQAAVEGLGFRRCWRRVSESWTEAQKCRQELGGTRWGKLVETLTLPVSADRESLGYSFQPLCAPSVFQRRYELNRMVLGSRSFSLLGNRQAVSVDYMPVLRSICRSQRPRRGEEPVRCVNYLSSMQLGLSKSTLQLLAEDF